MSNYPHLEIQEVATNNPLAHIAYDFTASTLTMSDHPLDQVDPHTSGSDSASSKVRTRKRDKFRKLWGLSKSKTKEVKLKTSNQPQRFQPSSQQSTRPFSVVSQGGNLLSNFHLGDSQSTPPSAAEEKALSALIYTSPILEDIFDEGVLKPTIKTEPPHLQQRIEMAQQLIYCNALLLRDTLSPVKSKSAAGEAAEISGPLVLQDPILDKNELNWLETTKKDPMEVDCLR